MACCKASLANNIPRQGQRPVRTRVESEMHKGAVETETCSSTARFESKHGQPVRLHRRIHTSPSTKRLTFFRNSMTVCNTRPQGHGMLRWQQLAQFCHATARYEGLL